MRSILFGSAAILTALSLTVGACGTEPTIKAQAPTTTTTLGLSQPVPGGTVSLSVRYDLPLRSGSTPVWYLTVSNDGLPAILTFPSGQKGEVVLVGADGAEVYRWSANRTFIQAIANESLPTADSLVYELEGTELKVPPGEYELVASILATPEILPVRQKVIIEPAAP